MGFIRGFYPLAQSANGDTRWHRLTGSGLSEQFGSIGNAPGVWQVRRLVADGKETCRAKEAGSRRSVTTWIGTPLFAVHRKRADRFKAPLHLPPIDSLPRSENQHERVYCRFQDHVIIRIGEPWPPSNASRTGLAAATRSSRTRPTSTLLNPHAARCCGRVRTASYSRMSGIESNNSQPLIQSGQRKLALGSSVTSQNGNHHVARSHHAFMILHAISLQTKRSWVHFRREQERTARSFLLATRVSCQRYPVELTESQTVSSLRVGNAALYKRSSRVKSR